MWRFGVFGGLTLLWLIILLPLKAVMIMAGGAATFGYQDVYGSIWDGRIYDMRIAGVPVREIEMAADPLPLFTGRLAARWRVSDASARGDGRISMGGDEIRARDISLLISIERLGLRSFPGLDTAQMIDLDIDELTLRDGDCVSVSGRVRTAALQQFAQTFGFEGPSLLGLLSCDAGRIRVALDGASEDIDVTGTVTINANSFSWDLALQTQRAELADVLALAGMTRNGDIWTYRGSENLAAH